MAEEQKTVQEQIDQLNERLEALAHENQALREQLAASTPAASKEKVKLVIPEKPFKVGGKKYRFTLPKFHYKGKMVTAVDALTDPALLEELVNKNVSFVREVA